MAEAKKRRIVMVSPDALAVRKAYLDPPGFEHFGKETAVDVIPSQQLISMKQSALYSRATGQLKNVGMVSFMMWMSGNQIHLFSMMMTASGIYSMLSALFTVQKGLAFALWKVNGMGLLPTHSSDFVNSLLVPRVKQLALAASSL